MELQRTPKELTMDIAWTTSLSRCFSFSFRESVDAENGVLRSNMFFYIPQLSWGWASKRYWTNVTIVLFIRVFWLYWFHSGLGFLWRCDERGCLSSYSITWFLYIVVTHPFARSCGALRQGANSGSMWAQVGWPRSELTSGWHFDNAPRPVVQFLDRASNSLHADKWFSYLFTSKLCWVFFNCLRLSPVVAGGAPLCYVVLSSPWCSSYCETGSRRGLRRRCIYGLSRWELGPDTNSIVADLLPGMWNLPRPGTANHVLTAGGFLSTRHQRIPVMFTSKLAFQIFGSFKKLDYFFFLISRNHKYRILILMFIIN